MKKQQGFTMIELVMVIVILGILAAFALPRFANLGSDARKASLDGMAGNVRSAAALAHSVALAQGKSAGGTVTMEGNVITLQNLYPDDTATGGIGDALQDVSNSGYTIAMDGTTLTFEPVNGGSATCRVEYVAPSALNNPPTINIVNGGC